MVSYLDKDLCDIGRWKEEEENIKGNLRRVLNDCQIRFSFF